MKYAFMTELGGAGDRFGDNLCVDCANLSCVSGHNQFTNTKFTRRVTKISKSIYGWDGWMDVRLPWRTAKPRTIPYVVVAFVAADWA